MKFPISVSNKKLLSKMDTEKNNKINTLACSQEEERQIIKDPDSVSLRDKSLTKCVTKEKIMSICETDRPVIDNNPCLENINNSDSLENFDTDGKLFGTFKRNSLDRSVSWDDSGFNSCTSEDRDDISERLSFDLSFLGDDEDEITSTTRQNPFRHLQRSRSLDYESSDYSEAHFQNSKALSYTTYSDLEKNFVLWRDSNCKLFNEDNNKALKDFMKKDRKGKNESISSLDVASDISIPTLKPSISRRVRKDQNNNSNQIELDEKNLISSQKQSSLRMYGCVQEHGLFAIFCCVLYTLILGFIVGVCGLLFQAIKLILNKEDLEDLRATVIKSRQSEKQSSLVKKKGSFVHVHRKRICS